MKVTLLTAMFLLSAWSIGQECEALKTSSVEKITDYLQHAGDDSAVAACVQVAFHRMAAPPPEQAIPLLTTYLGYKRPLNESERHGFFMHGKAPDVLYPAVQELYSIGGPAEPVLVSFLARNKENTGPESKNAVYTLLLIHHGDAISVVQELHKASVSSASGEARDRLQAAARDASKWCDERARSECEDALKMGPMPR
jgi:hypothetical protein